MSRHPRNAFIRILRALSILALFAGPAAVAQAQEAVPGRDPKQPIDEAYTAKIRKYTTAPYFLSPLVDYLPASKTVPTPEVVLGDVAGAPGILPYAEEVYKYMRLLEAASPRVKVYSIGHTEEGREMIAVAISSEENLKHLEENRARLAKLADPRTIHLDDAEADRLVSQSVPIYYLTGTIHSPETGAPTALMELAYRLAVDESPYIRDIREGMVTLITPVTEVDGRDRMVDIYRWHLAHPGQNWPPLIYWGKYVAHDNNRDAMGVTLKLTENVLNTFVAWKAQVLHDLHESVPYLYDNTVGDGPFNAWVDPILANEWEMIGWRNVADLTRFGMPGVFTHGVFDTWSPGYLMFVAAMHNGISRLYETFGNGGADTVERTLEQEEYARTWYRQNPPLPKALWSQRNNNNYEETGILTSLHYFQQNRALFLKNFYLKAKRSVTKPGAEGPAAYVLSADDPRPSLQADLLQILEKQQVEISRATASFTVTVPVKKAKTAKAKAAEEKDAKPAATTTRTFPAGSYIIRMDQPYSRIADALLDYQYWSPDDPQKTPYDDTGWTFGEQFNVQVTRVTDVKVLDAAMERVKGIRAPGGVAGTGSIFAINNTAEPELAALRYRLRDTAIDAAEEPFEAAGVKFNRGSFLLRNANRDALEKAAADLGLRVVALADAPSVKTHPLRAARIALLHTWLSTQTEGWWRQALDLLGIPYAYISTQTVAKDDNLNAKYDVILFPPIGFSGSTNAIVNGIPTGWGNPLPWLNTPETPNLVGKNDSTEDVRPGLGWRGVANLQAFVQRGGVLLTVMDTARFAASLGLEDGVNAMNGPKLKSVGSVLKTNLVDAASPIAYGYGETLSAYCDNGPAFSLTSVVGGGRFRRLGAEIPVRPTGRGTLEDPDFTPGRASTEVPEEPKVEGWENPPVTDEQLRNGYRVIPPAMRPRVIFRYADTRELLVSGLLEGGDDIAQRPSVVDVPAGQGHVVMFSTNPVWRGETRGSYALVLNTILNFDSLNAGRKLAAK
ncbi:MAG TPA: M14 family zinc carboxypeptidase [Candidatus Acidoferrales bacterium]|nr:M14 family zinc carboxypeptidase [Candidatus Acidoferrales bacterium]